MLGPLEILFAFLLDSAVGDPLWLPHPVRVMGKAISGIERILRRFCTTVSSERMGGVILVLFMTLPVYFITDHIVEAAAGASSGLLAVVAPVLIVFLAATTIATRELIRSARLVIAAVQNGDLVSARQQVSMIVGRDTRDLSGKGVLKATIETLAENLSDGIVAPLFYLALGGLPLAMTYKAVNTLDSMVGYKNARYRYFGWAAARLDDLANYLPSRITGLVITLSVFLVVLIRNERRAFPVAARSLSVMMRDGRKHPSPNSGIPEAAMAGALGVMLGGPSTYGGVLSDKPFIGDEEKDDYRTAALEAVSLVKVSSVLAASLAIATAALRSMQ